MNAAGDSIKIPRPDLRDDAVLVLRHEAEAVIGIELHVVDEHPTRMLAIIRLGRADEPVAFLLRLRQAALASYSILREWTCCRAAGMVVRSEHGP